MAFVDFESKDEAANVLSEMDKTMIAGKRIKVQFARVKNKGHGGKGDSSGIRKDFTRGTGSTRGRGGASRGRGGRGRSDKAGRGKS